jgi:tetratricopeptide (TPR) repeat protein
MARYDDAVAICKDEIAQNATNMDSYTVLTWALLRQRKYAEVTEWGTKGLKVNPNDYRVVETMGEAYFYLNNFKESLKHMQKYVDSAPQGDRVSVAYFFIGEIYRLQQRFRHADISYTMAVRLEPNLSLWWYRLGSVRESAGDYAPAVDAYERALKLNPGYQEASEALERAKKRIG